MLPDSPTASGRPPRAAPSAGATGHCAPLSAAAFGSKPTVPALDNNAVCCCAHAAVEATVLSTIKQLIIETRSDLIPNHAYLLT